MMLRLATVGSGKIVGYFLEGLKNVSGIRHAAVYSRSFERGLEFAGEHGLGEDAVWTDLEKLADSGMIDAVYIATPTGCMQSRRRFSSGGGFMSSVRNRRS